LIEVIQTGPFGVNTYIVNLKGSDVFIVDPASCDFSNDKNVIIDYLEKNNLNLKAIILSHGHFDHIAGVSVLKNKFNDVPVFIHKNDSDFINENAEETQRKLLKPLAFESFLPFVKSFPKIELLDTDKIPLDDFSDWKVINTPGHSQGSICLYNEKEKLLISGDTIFYRSYGRTDLPGGNEKTMQETLLKLYTSIAPDTLIFPGHDYFGFKLQDNI
jgi:glyoxylase-like metal-dependent hydrolase (beta-lactamase superfamily II)